MARFGRAGPGPGAAPQAGSGAAGGFGAGCGAVMAFSFVRGLLTPPCGQLLWSPCVPGKSRLWPRIAGTGRNRTARSQEAHIAPTPSERTLGA
ncbi:hypothetical protein GCM10027360_32130 [Amycolatopsis echigonensis]